MLDRLRGVMESNGPSNGVNVWKFIAGVLGSALLTLIIAYPRDSVSRGDFEQFKHEERAQFDQVQRDQAAKDADLTTQLRQLQIDTGRIAEHLGVAAHPGPR